MLKSIFKFWTWIPSIHTYILFRNFNLTKKIREIYLDDSAILPVRIGNWKNIKVEEIDEISIIFVFRQFSHYISGGGWTNPLSSMDS